MSFYQTLQDATEAGRHYVAIAPIIANCLQAKITRDEYAAFLCQAYHHVKHTTPLLMATGARLGEDKEWLREAIAEYIAEELGHQEWILNDLAALGFDKDKARASKPNASTELMVAYAYDKINRINPVGFFGMVQVLEGTSVRIADAAADGIQQALGLPDKAFSYLRSHGALDQEHVAFFKGLMNRIVAPVDQQEIIDSATMFYQLYGNVFRELTGAQVQTFALS